MKFTFFDKAVLGLLIMLLMIRAPFIMLPVFFLGYALYATYKAMKAKKEKKRLKFLKKRFKENAKSNLNTHQMETTT